MVAHAVENNSHLDLITLNDHYEGVGVHAVNTVQADKALKYFFIQVKRNHTCGETSLRSR